MREDSVDLLVPILIVEVLAHFVRAELIREVALPHAEAVVSLTGAAYVHPAFCNQATAKINYRRSTAALLLKPCLRVFLYISDQTGPEKMWILKVNWDVQ